MVGWLVGGWGQAGRGMGVHCLGWKPVVRPVGSGWFVSNRCVPSAKIYVKSLHAF